LTYDQKKELAKFRITDQPNGWFGGTVKVDWLILISAGA